MTTTTALSSSRGAGDYARVLDELCDDPEMRKAIANKERYEQEFQSIDALVKDSAQLTREERLTKFAPYVDDMWKTESHRLAPWGVAAVGGFIAAGAAAGIALASAGVLSPGLGVLFGAGVLICAFNGVPKWYGTALKKWILPGAVDKQLMKGIREQRDHAKEKVEVISKKVDSAKRDVMKKAEERKQIVESAVVEDSDCEYVVIGGGRLEKKKQMDNVSGSGFSRFFGLDRR